MKIKKNQKVSIIVLNWNGWENTIECLESIYRINYLDYEIILVDNNSQDDSIKKIKQRWGKRVKCVEYSKDELESGKYLGIKKKLSYLPSNKKLFILKNDKNYGFAEGNNIAIRQIIKEDNSKYILLLNNDTVVDKNFLNELIKVAESKKSVGVVGGVIYNYFTKKIDFAGGKINWWLGHPYLLKKFNSSETEFIIGCSMLIPLKIIKSVGGFDRNYFAYFEDTDFCERVKNFGKKIYITKNSKIYHKISQTSKFKSDFYIFYYARNRIIFNKKYNKNLFKYLTFLFFQYIIKTIGAYFYLDKGKFKAWIEGIRSVNKEKHF